eukprot:symbB.v1.2.042238.t1/scaffold9536.1/size2958/1
MRSTLQGSPASPQGAEEAEVPEAARTPDPDSRPTSSSFGGTWADLADREDDDDDLGDDPLLEAAAVDRLSEVLKLRANHALS